MSTFPYYCQLDQMDCGPTCLRMVAKHYGRSFTAQSLREKAQIGKDGVSMLGVAEAAEAIGFRSLGVKLTYEKLAQEAPLPCIVHWGQNHFVVVYAIKGTGYAKTSRQWLGKIWGGRKPTVENDALFRSPVQALVDDKAIEVVIPSQTPDQRKAPDVKHGRGPSVRGTVYVADPGKGLVAYSAEEFC